MRKSSGITVALAAGLLLLLVLDARAQENLPVCVSTCMEDIAVGIGCVSSENLPCTCRTPGFVDNVLQCFSTSCTSQADQQRGSDEVRGQCIAYTSAVVTPSETGLSSASATGTSSTLTFTSTTVISEPPSTTTTIVTVTSSGTGSSAPSGTPVPPSPTSAPSSSQSVVATVTSTRFTPQPSGSSTSGSAKVNVDWKVEYLWTVLVGIGLGALVI